MSNIPFKKISYLPFTTYKLSELISYKDIQFIFAFTLSFEFIFFIFISYLWKRRLYNIKGYLKAEKGELKYLLEDIKENSYNSSKIHTDTKRLLSLLTENRSTINLNNQSINQSNLSFGQHNYNKKKSQKLQIEDSIDQNSPSKIEQMARPFDNSISMNMTQKFQISQQQEQKSQQITQNIIFESNKVNNYKSRSGLLDQAEQEQSNNNSFVFNSQQKNMNENANIFNLNKNNSKINKFSRNNSSALSSCTSILRTMRQQSNTDNSSIIPTLNNLSIQPPSQNKKLKESFCNIIDLEDKQSNDNQKTFQNQSIGKTSLNQQKSLINNIQKNKETNILFNNQRDSQTNKYDYEKQSEQKMKNKINDISIDSIVDIQESTFYQRFIRNWRKLFVRHSIICNTIKQDTILFPRVLKIIIINLFINIQFLSGTFIQIYEYNQQVEYIEQKYKGRNDHSIYKQKIIPTQDQNIIIFSIGISAIALCFMMLLTYISKADKDILFINMNNQQLLKNLLQIQNGQTYKLFVGLFISFSLASFNFLQYNSFIKSMPVEFIDRWVQINSLIIIFIINIFDLVYLSSLAILKAASQNSSRFNCVFNFLVQKISWWAL